MINRVKEILKERELFRDEYFDKNKYVIDSFSQEYDRIFYIYDSALGTTKLQGLDTKEFEKIVQELKKCNLKKILTISISPKVFEGDYITILTDTSIKQILGIHKKIVTAHST